eukprot:gene20517-31454_t
MQGKEEGTLLSLVRGLTSLSGEPPKPALLRKHAFAVLALVYVPVIVGQLRMWRGNISQDESEAKERTKKRALAKLTEIIEAFAASSTTAPCSSSSSSVGVGSNGRSTPIVGAAGTALPLAIATGEEDGLAERKGGSGGDADAGGVTAGHLIKSAAYRAAVVAYIAKCGEVGSSAARSPTASPLPDGDGAAGAGTQQHAGFAPVAPPSYPPPPPPEHRRPPLRTSGAAAAAGAGGEGVAAAAATGEMATQPYPLLNAEALEHTDDDDADTDADADANLYTNGNFTWSTVASVLQFDMCSSST